MHIQGNEKEVSKLMQAFFFGNGKKNQHLEFVRMMMLKKKTLIDFKELKIPKIRFEFKK